MEATSETAHQAWEHVRAQALERDGHRCTVARLLGGDCSGVLHVHHVVPVAEGGAPLDVDNTLTACASHHPMVEALRRAILRARQPRRSRRCHHFHPYPQGRAECERRLNQAA